MIESNIIKRFIVKTFMQYSRLSIGEVATKVMETLESKIFINESIIIKVTQQVGKIAACNKENYTINLLSGETVEATRAEMQRKTNVIFDDVTFFLECVTKQTAFGRILIQNVFDKISKPDFGDKSYRGAPLNHPVPQTRSNRYPVYRNNQKHTEIGFKEPQSKATGASNIQKPYTASPSKALRCEAGQKHLEMGDGQQELPNEVLKNPGTQALKRTKPKHEELQIETLPRFTVENFVDDALKDLIKIYQILVNFKDDLGLEDFTVESLGLAIYDPEYNNELICKIHSTFIDIIENEAKTRGERFYDSLSFIIDELKPYETDVSVQSLKKRVPMNLENWKSQVKIFISNLSKEMDEDRLLLFIGVFKKSTLDLRLSFLILLVDILTLTDKFREFVDAKQNWMKMEKAKLDELQATRKKLAPEEDEEANRVSKEMQSIEANLLVHPLRVHIGKYKSNSLFLMKTNIILKSANVFYILEEPNVQKVIRYLNPHFKLEKNTAMNLKAISDIIYK